jgi:transcriptional regulator of arginine metabolism
LLPRSRGERAAKVASTETPRARRQAIRELVRTTAISTQEQLRGLLADRGFDVTQATLSRDLARLGARHVTRPDGGAVYELEESRVPSPADPVVALASIVRTVADNGSLVVVHTQPGAAQAVARSIDMARFSELLGTLAGDDTIFLAPVRGVTSKQLRARLSEFLARAMAPP